MKNSQKTAELRDFYIEGKMGSNNYSWNIPAKNQKHAIQKMVAQLKKKNIPFDLSNFSRVLTAGIGDETENFTNHGENTGDKLTFYFPGLVEKPEQIATVTETVEDSEEKTMREVEAIRQHNKYKAEVEEILGSKQPRKYNKPANPTKNIPVALPEFPILF